MFTMPYAAESKCHKPHGTMKSPLGQNTENRIHLLQRASYMIFYGCKG